MSGLFCWGGDFWVCLHFLGFGKAETVDSRYTLLW